MASLQEQEQTVLLSKRLSFSDLADTVLQTGRIVLPRNQMEANADQIIDIANTGARIINPDNNKATYELTLTDMDGREWPMLLKQWTANSAQAPRPIYVLEKTSACMKSLRASPGHILQAFITNDDPDTLRITVTNPSSTGSTSGNVHRAPAAATAPSSKDDSYPPGGPAPTAPPHRHQQHHFNLDMLLSAADAYDTINADKINNDTPTGHPSNQITSSIPRIIAMPTATGATPAPTAAPTSAATGIGYVLGVCQRSAECYKEAGHAGFCVSGPKQPPQQPLPSPLHSQPEPQAFATITTQAPIDVPIDYLARREKNRSPADAFNLAAVQMQRQQHSPQEEGKKISPPSAPSTAAAAFSPPQSYFGKKLAPFTTNRANPYGSAINTPLYSSHPTAAPPRDHYNSFPTAAHGGGPVNVNGFVGNSSFSMPQRHITSGTTTITTPTKHPNSTITTPPPPPPPITKEVCPTWIVITYKNLRGDLHVPTMTVTIMDNRNKTTGTTGTSHGGVENKMSSVSPMSISSFQLLAEAMQKPIAGTTATATATATTTTLGSGIDLDIVMVEGAGMSLQRWCKSWDLQLVLSAGVVSPPREGASGGGAGGSGFNIQGVVQTPLQRVKSTKIEPYSTENPRPKRHSLRRSESSTKTSALAAAMKATEQAIAAATNAFTAVAAPREEEEEEEKASPLSMIDDGSGSTDSDMEAGEALLSMMDIISDTEKGASKEKVRGVDGAGAPASGVTSILFKPQAVPINLYRCFATV